MSNFKTDKFDKPDRFDVFMRVSLFFMAGAAMFLLLYFVPNYQRRRVATEFNQCASNCKVIGEAMEMYAAKHNKNYPLSLTMLTPDYLQTIPTCAKSGTNQGYIDSYQVSKDYKAYTFYCQGDNHSAVGVDKNFPQYNSREKFVFKR